MGWLIDKIRSALRWLADQLLGAFAWLAEALGHVVQFVLNRVQYAIVVVLSTVTGFTPTQTLASLWSEILRSMTWFNGWVAYVAIEGAALDELLARLTYYTTALVAAYTIRLGFTYIRGALDVL